MATIKPKGHPFQKKKTCFDIYLQRKEDSNQLFKSQFQMNEEEEKELQQLEGKYRDRAKERRQGIMLEEDNTDDEYAQLNDEEENDEDLDQLDEIEKQKQKFNQSIVKLKGLDFELLNQEKANLEKEKVEEVKLSKLKAEQTLQSIKYNKPKFYLNKLLLKQRETLQNANFHKHKDPGPMARSIQNVLISQKKEKSRGQFPKPYSYYQFDLKTIIGGDIPNIIYKSKQSDSEKYVMPIITPTCLQKVEKIMKIIKFGNKNKGNLHDQTKIEGEEKVQSSQQINKPQQQQLQQNLQQSSVFQMENNIMDDEEDIFADAPKINLQTIVKKESNINSHEKTIQLLNEDEKQNYEDHQQQLQKEADILLPIQPVIQISVNTQEQSLQQLKNVKQENKRKNPFEELEDHYMECFPKKTLSLNEMKQLKQLSKQQRNNNPQKKRKKEDFDKECVQIERILQEKGKGANNKSSEQQ